MTISNLWFAQCNAELRFRSDNSFPRDGSGQLFTTTNTHFCHFIEKKNIGRDVFTQWEWGWYFHMLTNFVKEQIFTPRHGTERCLNGNPTQEEITLVLLGMLLVYILEPGTHQTWMYPFFPESRALSRNVATLAGPLKEILPQPGLEADTHWKSTKVQKRSQQSLWMLFGMS